MLDTPDHIPVDTGASDQVAGIRWWERLLASSTLAASCSTWFVCCGVIRFALSVHRDRRMAERCWSLWLLDWVLRCRSLWQYNVRMGSVSFLCPILPQRHTEWFRLGSELVIFHCFVCSCSICSYIKWSSRFVYKVCVCVCVWYCARQNYQTSMYITLYNDAVLSSFYTLLSLGDSLQRKEQCAFPSLLLFCDWLPFLDALPAEFKWSICVWPLIYKLLSWLVSLTKPIFYSPYVHI